MPGRLRAAHRQTALFLGAVVVPSLVLLVVGLRTIRQEHELREKRKLAERLRLVELVRREVFTRLEGIKLRVAAGQVMPRDPEVALLARLASDRLVMPWENTSARPAHADAFQAALRQAECQLHQLRNPEAASAHARQAARTARTPAERARADLLLTVCLSAAGDRQGARGVALRLLQLNPPPQDEYGVPYALYASQRLLNGASPEDRRRILDAASTALETTWLSPLAAHMAADLLVPMHPFLAARAAELEQVADLPSQLPSLKIATGQTWTLFGNSPWLLSLTGRPGDPERFLIAVRAREVLAAVQLPAGLQWVLGTETPAAPLGELLPGLRLAALPDAATDGARSPHLLYLSALLLVLSVTAFSAWLLIRDVRREARLARLQAQFVSSVSHELRTPISTIRTCAELIHLGRIKDQHQVFGYVEAILGETERLSRLVDGVLDFSRTEQGERTYHFQSVALAEVLQSAAHQLTYQLAQGNFQLRITADPDVPPVNADPEALAQAVANLLSNAIKYSAERREIDLSLHRDGHRAVLRVRDYGIGIAPEQQARIFERFHRALPPGGRQVPGTGLGLTIADQIVKAHRGRVTVDSRPGQGSTFSIFLPLSEPS